MVEAEPEEVPDLAPAMGRSSHRASPAAIPAMDPSVSGVSSTRSAKALASVSLIVKGPPCGTPRPLPRSGNLGKARLPWIGQGSAPGRA